MVDGCLISLLSGTLLAWPSPFIVKIIQDETYSITEAEASYFTVIQPLGMCVFSPFFVPVTNSIGRKRTTLIAAIPLMTSLLIKAFAKNVWLLYLSRFLAGAGDAIVFSSLPSYIGEISTPKVRGIWGNVFICSVFFGQFVMNIVGSYFSVQNTSFILLIIPIAFLLTFSFMPESPYFYTMKGKYIEAKESLQRLRRTKDVDNEFEDIKIAVERQMKESGTWKDLVTVKANRKALVALLFLRTSQTFTGIYVFAAYTQFIFEKAGGNFSAQTSAILYTGLTFLMYSISSSFSDKLGRRVAFITSMFLASIVVFAEATYFLIDIKYKSVDLSDLQWFPLAGMLTFVIVSSFGVGIIPTLMYSELFSASVKAQGISAATVAFSLISILVNNIFYYFNAATGLYGPFFLFGCSNVLSTAIAYFLIPETKGKTLEEIQQMLKK